MTKALPMTSLRSTNPRTGYRNSGRGCPPSRKSCTGYSDGPKLSRLDGGRKDDLSHGPVAVVLRFYIQKDLLVFDFNGVPPTAMTRLMKSLERSSG
jgi:hypothetical protein